MSDVPQALRATANALLDRSRDQWDNDHREVSRVNRTIADAFKALADTIDDQRDEAYRDNDQHYGLLTTHINRIAKLEHDLADAHRIIGALVVRLGGSATIGTTSFTRDYNLAVGKMDDGIQIRAEVDMHGHPNV